MSSLADIQWRGRRVRIEHAFVAPERKGAPLVVFLHEGLGSLAMWREFPKALCDAAGARGLVYSRPGYGRSTPRPPEERWQPDFMHRQAFEVLHGVSVRIGEGETLTGGSLGAVPGITRPGAHGAGRNPGPGIAGRRD